jgi:hypothetical protein
VRILGFDSDRLYTGICILVEEWIHYRWERRVVLEVAMDGNKIDIADLLEAADSRLAMSSKKISHPQIMKSGDIRVVHRDGILKSLILFLDSIQAAQESPAVPSSTQIRGWGGN